MSLMIDDIAAYLAYLGFGTIVADMFGTDEIDIFKGSIPDSPDNCIGVFSYAGSPPDTTHDKKIIDNPGLQIIVRNKSIPDGLNKIEAIRDALHATANQTIGGSFYLLIMANGDPTPLGPDENGREKWSLSFTINKRR
jgi:hypothetical protein